MNIKNKPFTLGELDIISVANSEVAQLRSKFIAEIEAEIKIAGLTFAKSLLKD